MPIELSFQVVRHSKKETTDLIFEAVNHAMKVHSELGRYLNEECYANALAARFGDRAKTEALVRVRHSDFTKDYFIDFVLDSALPLELKATTQIVSAHRSQLMQYLLFADMETGKVINFRPTSLQHDFVNNHRTLAQRQSFEIKNSTPIPHSHSGVFDNFTTITCFNHY